jgi:hypothetical protein
MAAILDFPSDDRIVALIQGMQARVRRVSASRYQLSLGFDGLAVRPSAWDMLFVVQTEIDKAFMHLGLAYRALTGSLGRQGSGTPPRDSRFDSR